MKEFISRIEYLQLCGLLALAKTHIDQLKELESSLAELFVMDESDDGFGHLCDSIYSEYTPDVLLKKLKVEKLGRKERKK